MKPIPAGNALVVKQHNSRLVLGALKGSRSATIRDLAAATGLSVPTVGSLIQDLVGIGAAAEGDLVPSQGGRPSRLYRFNAEHQLALAVFTREVEGRDTVCLRVADLYGTVLAAEDHPFQPTGLAAFEPFLDGLTARFPAIGAIGFGLPGIEYGGTITALDYRALVGAPILDHFARRYGVPVLFENDVNAAVLGRGRRPGAAASEAYLYFPQKYIPGCGLRVDGRLLKGYRHFAGEIGWLPLGVRWGDPALVDDADRFADAAARVVISLTAVVAPESVVLFGEFLTPGHLEGIADRCRRHLPAEVVPALSLITDFTTDFQEGLLGLTLDRIEP